MNELDWQQIVSAWNLLDRDRRGELFIRVQITHAPKFRGGSLPIEGEAPPVIDWWPFDQIEERKAHLKKHGPFVPWETRSGAIATAEALSRAGAEGRIAVWIEAVLWEKSNRQTWPPYWPDVPHRVYIAARRKLSALDLDFRHHACTTAFPWASEQLFLRLGEWLNAAFASAQTDDQRLARTIEYVLLRRALVLSECALVKVAAVPDGIAPLPTELS